MLHLRLLGGFALTRDGATVAIASRKARALLAWLALQRGRDAPRTRAADLLWDDDPGRARASLRQALAILRRALGDDSDALRATSDAIGLDVTRVTVDALELERLLGEDIAAAADHWGGELLADLDVGAARFDEWREAEASAWRGVGLKALEGAMVRADDPARVVELAQRALAIEPYREPVHHLLLRALVAQGRRAAAQAHLETLRATLREIGRTPSAQTLAALDAPAPPLPAPPANRLRPITVLATRAHGLDQLRDPEAAHEALTSLRQRVDDTVARFGGEPLGGTVDRSAYAFGLSRAVGDPVEAASRAADALHALGVSLGIGVATGPILAGPSRPTGAALFDASALADAAAPGTTRRSGAVEAAEAARDPGRPLVGRRRPLALLQLLLDDCAQSGVGQTIILRGAPGIGKTRLAEEAMARATAYRARRARILDFGGRPLLAQLLSPRPDVGLPPEEELLIRDALDEPVGPRERRWLDALDAPTRARRRELALTRLVRAVAERGPTVWLVDDAHWADAATVGLLAAIASAEGAVLLLTTRADEELDDPRWRALARRAVTIDLEPLGPDEAILLVRDLADDATVRRWVERSGGNPLFLLQLALGRADDAVPGSVAAIVQARLDRLSPSARRTAEAASVLGISFDDDALAAVLDGPHLDPLVEAGLVRRDGAGWQFAHALLRDAVYAGLPRADRSGHHRRAARWYVDRDPGLHADHLRLAGDRSAPAYLAAIRRAVEGFELEAALALADRALTSADAPDRAALALARGDVLRELGRAEESRAAFADVYASASDADLRARAALGQAAALRVLGVDDDGALALLDEAAALPGPAAFRAEVHGLRGSLHFMRGDFEGCLDAHERALALAREARSVELEARALSGLGDAWYVRGRFRTAFAHFDACLATCDAHGLVRIEMANAHMRGVLLGWLGELERGAEDCRFSLDAARSLGDPRGEVMALDSLVGLEILRDRPALELAEAQLALTRRIGSRRFEASALRNRALAGGAAAEADLDEAWRLSAECGHAFVGPAILGSLAILAPDRAAWALEEGERLLASGAVSHNFLDFRRDAALALARVGDRDGVRRQVDALEAYVGAEALPSVELVVALGRAWADGAPLDAPRGRAEALGFGALVHLADALTSA